MPELVNDLMPEANKSAWRQSKELRTGILKPCYMTAHLVLVRPLTPLPAAFGISRDDQFDVGRSIEGADVFSPTRSLHGRNGRFNQRRCECIAQRIITGAEESDTQTLSIGKNFFLLRSVFRDLLSFS